MKRKFEPGFVAGIIAHSRLFNLKKLRDIDRSISIFAIITELTIFGKILKRE